MTLLNEYLRERFGCKVYKIAINAGLTCPNRDGKLGFSGCIFCSAGGSGEFAGDASGSITDQIEDGKKLVSSKIKEGKFIAYFQAYTNTYAPVSTLRKVFSEAVNNEDIVALSIATRPDCLPDDVLDLLEELNRIKPVWVELGLQTIHKKTADYIRRGYDLDVYDNAVSELKKRGIEVITHVILGLPGEDMNMMKETVKYVCDHGTDGIKLQLLHVLKIIPETTVIHRLTGDGDKKILVAPLWSGDKKHMINRIRKEVLT